MINDTIRIRLSLGLIVVAIVHAILLGVVFTTVHYKPVQAQPSNAGGTQLSTILPSVGTIEKLQEPQSVNLQAQGEIKQQIRNCPPNCLPQRVYPAPVVVQPTIVQPTVVTPTVTPTVAPPVPATPTSWTHRSQQRAAGCYASLKPCFPPPKKSYQIALFVNADATSQRLQEWFTQNKQLAALKESCEFQVYTSTNAIYKTRYADIVPAEQFPVVLFQDSTGGHIHAAGRSMIPSTAEELYSDLRHGYLLYKQAKQAQKTGAVKTKGYSGTMRSPQRSIYRQRIVRMAIARRHPLRIVGLWIESAIYSMEPKTLATH